MRPIILPWLLVGVLGCSCGVEPPPRPDEDGCDDPSGICVKIVDGMAHVPTGEFWMGCRPEVDPSPVEGDCNGELLLATPYRKVHLSGYWIDVVEVSFGDFAECIDAGACAAPLDEDWKDRPRDWPATLIN